MIPPVIQTNNLPDGVNARHNLFCIRIRPDLKHYEAILAQERYEWFYLRKWGLLTMLPIVVLAVYIGGIEGWVLGILAIPAHVFGPRWPANLRRMEIIGHTIEWIMATERLGAPKASYLKSEAYALTRYKQFKGWTLEECMDAMVKAEPIARKYV